jgi:hypothetical protein
MFMRAHLEMLMRGFCKVTEIDKDRNTLIESGVKYVKQVSKKKILSETEGVKSMKGHSQFRESGFSIKLFFVDFSYLLNRINII